MKDFFPIIDILIIVKEFEVLKSLFLGGDLQRRLWLLYKNTFKFKANSVHILNLFNHLIDPDIFEAIQPARSALQRNKVVMGKIYIEIYCKYNVIL